MRDIDAAMLGPDITQALRLLELLGRERVLNVRHLAAQNKQKVGIGLDCLLLGGKVHLTLEFDFREEKKP